jgi:hypothetical protein
MPGKRVATGKQPQLPADFADDDTVTFTDTQPLATGNAGRGNGYIIEER